MELNEDLGNRENVGNASLTVQRAREMREKFEKPSRFVEITQPPQENMYHVTPGLMDAGKTIGMVNVDQIVAFKIPDHGPHQGPTQFKATNGEVGWVRESYINLYAMFAQKSEWKPGQQKWLERELAPNRQLDAQNKL